MDHRDIGIERLPRPRDSVSGDNTTRRRRHRRNELMRQAIEANQGRRGFFVPSFAVRRAVLITPDLLEFQSKLSDSFKRKPYVANDVGRMAMTLVEQRRLIDVFHNADVQPRSDEMQNVAYTIKDGLTSLLRSKPHKLPMPAGPVHVFGSDDKSIGVVPMGWRGFTARYPRKLETGMYGANSQIVAERNLAVGAISNAFTDGLDRFGAVSDVDMKPLFKVTPHVTIAKKEGERPISNDERAELNGTISEIIENTCPEFELFDPIVHLNLGRDFDETYQQQTGKESPEALFARRPKFRDYGHLLPDSVTSLT